MAVASISVFTIASKNYLAYVRVLLNSVARQHPEYKLYLCLADRVDGCFDPASEPFTIITAEDLGIGKFADFSLRYDIMEFNTAVKPFMFRWLFENTNADAVIYLDPDIRAYSRFDHLEKLLSPGTSVVLTPHITKPLQDGKSPGDYHMLQAGVFNLGFVAAQRCSESLEFMNWWARHLTTECVADFQSSLFVDQKWCDLAPCLLDELRILKDDGYNVAYWNLAHRPVTQGTNEQWLANGKPLAFYHFSGVNPAPASRRAISKHQTRFSWDDLPAIQPLFNGYIDELLAAGWNETRTWPYAYGQLGSGTQIHRLMRMVYRDVYREPAELAHDAPADLLLELCNQPDDPSMDEAAFRITRLMSLVYRQRPDVQAVFSLNTQEGRRQFSAWFEVAGEREYQLPACVTQQSEIRHQTGATTKKKSA